MRPHRPPTRTAGILSLRFGLPTLLLSLLGFPGTPVRAQETAPIPGTPPPIASISQIQLIQEDPGFRIALAGTSRLPAEASLLLAIRFQGYELTEYWARCYVADKGVFDAEIGPIIKVALAGTYTLDVSFDPSAQDLSLQDVFRNIREIRRVTRDFRIGSAEQENENRKECREHFASVLDGCEALMEDLVKTVKGIQAAKRFQTTDSPPRFDVAAFQGWSRDFRTRVMTLRDAHTNYRDRVFAHYFPEETLFTTPGLFDLLDIMCYHDLVPLHYKHKVVLPEWLYTIKARCEQIPMLPPRDTIHAAFQRDARKVREAVGLIEGRFDLDDVALTRDQIRELQSKPGGGVLRFFSLAAPPPGTEHVVSALPRLLERDELAGIANLPVWTYPDVPTAAVRKLYLATMVESPPPAEPATPPARIQLLGIAFDTAQQAQDEATKISLSLNSPPERRTFVFRKASVVMAITYWGRDERVAIWQYFNSVYMERMQ